MRAERRGQVAMELLIVLPILLTVLFASVELSLWLSAQQQVGLAAREGARVAATGGGEAAVNDAVKLTLGDGRYAVAQVTAEIAGAEPGDPVRVVVTVPVAAVVPDLLRFAGISVRDLSLVGQTVMRKE